MKLTPTEVPLDPNLCGGLQPTYCSSGDKQLRLLQMGQDSGSSIVLETDGDARFDMVVRVVRPEVLRSEV